MPSQPLKSSLKLYRVTTPSKEKKVESCSVPLPEAVARQHAHLVGPNQCCSTNTQTILAPESTVWSVVGRFDKPEAYKQFLKSCNLIFGNGGEVGSLREVEVVSGLPAGRSTERLEILDEERHILSFSVVGGDHRLKNYRSYTTLHPILNGNGTLVVESYVVDIPKGNTKEDTCVFIDTIVRCNLQSLAKAAENIENCRNCTTTTITTTPIRS